MSKLRVTGQSVPVPMAPPDGTIFDEVPSEGTTSLPSRSRRSATLKNLVPLQNETCPKIEPYWPLRQLPCCSPSGVAPPWNRSVPFNPKSTVTTAFAGSCGTAGLTAGVVPSVITSGSYTDSAPVLGFRIVACTKAPRLAALLISHPDWVGDCPPVPVSW